MLLLNRMPLHIRVRLHSVAYAAQQLILLVRLVLDVIIALHSSTQLHKALT